MAKHEGTEAVTGRDAPKAKAAAPEKKKQAAPEAEEPARKPRHAAPDAPAEKAPVEPAHKPRHAAPDAPAEDAPVEPAHKPRHAAPEPSAEKAPVEPAHKPRHAAPDAPAEDAPVEPAHKPRHAAPEPEKARDEQAEKDGKKPGKASAPAKKHAKRKKKPHSIEDYLEADAPKAHHRHPSKAARKRRRALRTTGIVLVSLLLALLCGALYAGSCVSASSTNLPNTYLDGIAVGGLTKEETAAQLDALGWNQEAQRPLTVELPAGLSFEIDRVKAGAALPLQKAVNAAFAYGHSGSWLADLMSWLRASASPVNLGDFTAVLDEDYLNGILQAALADFTAATTPAEPYTVDKENECLRMRKGAGAVTLNAGGLSAAVREALLNKADSVRYDALENFPAAPNFEEIYQALAVDPQDAYYTESWGVVDEVVGCTFSVEQAASVWNDTPWLEEVLVPLAITYPEKTGEGLRSLLFRDKLGEQTSYFPNSIQNRISNIELAASKIDGIVLNPGEVFSYNDTLGQRTQENGFLLAGAYSNGEVVEEIGGGICQVSSTLYCAVLYSQLGIRSRDSHYFKVDYLPWGQDATVSWPKPDFKFENTREYPIRIHAVADPIGRSITVEIWGTDTWGTHIELYEDRYTIYDPVWSVATGWNVYLFARVYDADGNLIETRELPVSTYHKHDEDIEWPAAKYEQDAANIEIG